MINKYGITHTGLLDSDLNEEKLLAMGLISKTGLFDAKSVEKADPKAHTETTGNTETHTETTGNTETGVIPTPTVPNSDGLVSTETYGGTEESDPKPNGKPTKPKRGGDAVANTEIDIETSTDAETADVAAESEDSRTSGRSRGLRANTNPKRPKIADEPEDHAELDATRPSGEDIPMDYL